MRKAFWTGLAVGALISAPALAFGEKDAPAPQPHAAPACRPDLAPEHLPPLPDARPACPAEAAR